MVQKHGRLAERSPVALHLVAIRQLSTSDCPNSLARLNSTDYVSTDDLLINYQLVYLGVLAAFYGLAFRNTETDDKLRRATIWAIPQWPIP